jgi:lipoprotein NlpD
MSFAPQSPAHRSRWPGLLALVLVLGACGEAHVVSRPLEQEPPVRIAPASSPAPRHAGSGEVEVARGDTLYGVAFRNGMDFRDLAAINGIEPPYTIYVGQVLKLRGEHAHSPAPPRPVVQASSHPQHAPVPVTPAPPHGISPSPPSTATTRAVASTPSQPMPTPFETVPSAASTPETTAPPTVASAPTAHPPPTDVVVPAQASHPPPAVAAVPTSAPHPPPLATVPQPPPVVHAAPPPEPHGGDVARTPSAAILPADVATVGGVHWRWPAKGSLLGRFMAGDATKQGIDIAGNPGDPVLAASDGVVVYSGSGLVGYGELVIIKHSDEWLSAYGHNRKRLVAEGQRVKAGQAIAEMGNSGAPRDELHFEIRRNGRPVDPLQYLPAR